MPKKKSKIESEFFQSVIGKKITIEYYNSSVTGKLVNVNPRNLTLYVEGDDGNMWVIPYRAKHIYQIIVYGITDEENKKLFPNKEQNKQAPYKPT